MSSTQSRPEGRLLSPYFSKLPKRNRTVLSAVVASAIVLISIVIAYQVFLTDVELVERQSTLRILSPGVKIRSGASGLWSDAGDLLPLSQGDAVRVASGGQAAVQIFDGSTVLLEENSSFNLVRAESTSKDTDDVFIEIELERGRMVVDAKPKPTANSTFIVWSGPTVGVIEGTLFQVELVDGSPARWTVSDGVVRIASISADSEGQPVFGLMRAGPGHVVTVEAGLGGPGPEYDRSGYRNLILDLVQTAVASNSSDVSVSELTLIAADDVSDIAAFRLTSSGEASAPSVERPLLRAVNVEDAGQSETFEFVPGVTIQLNPSVETPAMPNLPSPYLAGDGRSRAALKPGISVEYSYSVPNINRPIGVAVDPDRSRLYVTTLGGERSLLVFDMDGAPLLSLVPPDTSVLERSPMYVAVHPDGNVFVTDRRRSTIDIWSPTGEYVGEFPYSSEWSPLGIEFDERGYMYVTDVTPGNHRLMVFDSERTLVGTSERAGNASTQFSFPNGLAVKGDGTEIYLSDSNNGRVVKLNRQIEIESVLNRRGSGAMAMPRGLALDEEGRLYVVDRLMHGFSVWDLEPEAKLIGAFGDQGSEDAEFGFPNDVSSDQDGLLFITDTENNRVQVWSYR